LGVLHGRDLFSSKYITAEIKDASKRLWYVPIKRTLGAYFLADLEGQIYCFKMDNELCQYREKLTKSFRVYQYDTAHYRPIKDEIKELEMVLGINDLPKTDGMLADIFRILGSKEKKEFTPHTLKDLVDELGADQGKTGEIIPKKDPRYAQQIESIINFLDNLHVQQIVTPVRSVSEFIEDDLRSTDPQFLGTVVGALANLDFENKKVTNTPYKASLAWAKWGLMFAMIALVGFVVYYGYEQGWFDFITNATSSFSDIDISFQPPAQPDNPNSDVYWQSRYTPEELRAAIDRGEVDESKLPPNIQAMVKNVKSPTVETP
jgi:hypothetical protein